MWLLGCGALFVVVEWRLIVMVVLVVLLISKDMCVVCICNNEFWLHNGQSQIRLFSFVFTSVCSGVGFSCAGAGLRFLD